MSDEVQNWELWYTTGTVEGSRIIFKADSQENVVMKAWCELLMMGVVFNWAWVEYLGYYPELRRKLLKL
jgi:hypothetical protein